MSNENSEDWSQKEPELDEADQAVKNAQSAERILKKIGGAFKLGTVARFSSVRGQLAETPKIETPLPPQPPGYTGYIERLCAGSEHFKKFVDKECHGSQTILAVAQILKTRVEKGENCLEISKSLWEITSTGVRQLIGMLGLHDDLKILLDAKSEPRLEFLVATQIETLKLDDQLTIWNQIKDIRRQTDKLNTIRRLRAEMGLTAVRKTLAKMDNPAAAREPASEPAAADNRDPQTERYLQWKKLRKK